jgi:hypothetical protein
MSEVILKTSNPTQPSSPILNVLVGKKVLLHGKFERGERERLTAMAEAQQGITCEELDSSVDYLVLPDLSSGKTVQQKATSLNAKGATILVMDAAAFFGLIRPTNEQLAALIRSGRNGAAILAKAVSAAAQSFHGAPNTADITFAGECFDGADLSDFNFSGVEFQSCTFIGANLSNTSFEVVRDCDFARSIGDAASFGKIDRSRFVDARLNAVKINSHLDGSDFSGATLEGAVFSEQFWASATTARPAKTGPIMERAVLRSALFSHVQADGASFDSADLAGAAFTWCKLKAASFRDSILSDASLVACDLINADFTNAKLVCANLGEAKLTGANLTNADLAKANLRGATLDRGALSRAQNVAPDCTNVGTKGAALYELDTIVDQARQLKISFRVGDGHDGDGEELQITCYGGRKSAGHAHLFLPTLHTRVSPRPYSNTNLAAELLQAGAVFGHLPVRFETLDVSSVKASKGGKELRDLMMQGISEAFAQPIPDAKELAAATKVFREQVREKEAVDRERRQKAKELVEKKKETAERQIAVQIQKEVGKVTDIATFLKALELRVEKPKIDKATKMLKAERFKLFNDISDTHLSGVVKSQTDADLVYACRIESGGGYACCTQNLNICGGLRGSICKHLLVLIIGLVKAGELDPATIDGWVAKTHGAKSELNKEAMGEIFLRYKGAEAGEVDWRPTETVPEDYYAL